MIKRFALVALLTFTSFLLINCKTSVDSMITDYNTNFKEDTTEEDKVKTYPSPGDDDFSEDKMLDEEYFVWSDATLNLSGPQNCTSWSWTFTDPDDETETPVPVHYLGQDYDSLNDVWENQNLFINIPDSGLTSNKVYILTLQVVSKEGSSYKDKAAIVVYQHLII